MSYWIDLPATDMSERHSSYPGRSKYSVGTYGGGVELGLIVDIRIGEESIALTDRNLKELRKALKHIKKNRSLYGFPGAS